MYRSTLSNEKNTEFGPKFYFHYDVGQHSGPNAYIKEFLPTCLLKPDIYKFNLRSCLPQTFSKFEVIWPTEFLECSCYSENLKH